MRANWLLSGSRTTYQRLPRKRCRRISASGWSWARLLATRCQASLKREEFISSRSLHRIVPAPKLYLGTWPHRLPFDISRPFRESSRVTTYRILAADGVSPKGIALLAESPHFKVETSGGLKEDELIARIGEL